MALTIEAIYEDGVLKPVGKLDLEEHQRVRLVMIVRDGERPRLAFDRIQIPPEDARAIAEDPEFSLLGG